MASIFRESRRVNRLESLHRRKEHLEQVTKGEGLYLYRNRNVAASLALPKPTSKGQTTIPPKGEWEGDNYYMDLVRRHEAILVKEIKTPEQTRKEQPKEENLMESTKLILDQPDRVTTEGTMEQVVSSGSNSKKKKKLNESPQGDEKAKEVLLVEDPLSGVQIINE